MSAFPEEEPSKLIAGVRNGKPGALEEVFRRYFSHFVQYAHRRMENCQAAADGSDAAMSAMRTFYRRATEGEFDQLASRSDLFRLLSVIVLRKSLKYKAKNRRVIHTSTLNTDDSSKDDIAEQAVAREPEVEQVAIVQETIDQLLAGLSTDNSKQVVLMQLEGYPKPLIAQRLGISVRGVERHIRMIRAVLQSIEMHEEMQ